MGQALYRQYRPKSLSEVVGQEHITTSLRHAIEQGALAHAYLFTGPRGVGKTSIARILAHEINGLPYTDDSMHLDIIEIDAASNRRIDEIRELRDKVHTAPAHAEYKVYIIDEAHMLTREAFNALLKTLEEPPAHAVFILATTEAHKLPETIISRTQRFIFRPVAQESVIRHLRSIADTEKLTIDDEALALIAAHGEGSFRDSISLLDQMRGQAGPNGETTVSADAVRSVIGVPADGLLKTVRQAIGRADAAATVTALAELRQGGFSAVQVAKALARLVRHDVIDGKGQPGDLPLLSKLLEVPAAYDPENYLELALVGQALAGSVVAGMPAAAAAPAGSTPAAQTVTAVTAPAAPVPAPVQPTVDKPAFSDEALALKPAAPQGPAAAAAIATVPTTAVSETTMPASSSPGNNDLGKRIPVDDKLWPAVLDQLRKTHNTLYGIIRMARPVFYQDGLELGFVFPFHKKRVAENKNRDIICAVIKDLTGQDVSVHCVLVAKDAPVEPGGIPDFDDDAGPGLSVAEKPPAPVDPNISAISNIFGGAEVLDK